MARIPLRDAAPPVSPGGRFRSRRSAIRVAGLVVGDAVVFLIFASVGRASHSEAAGLGALGEVARTAAPFAIAWFAVAPFLGAYRRSATATPGVMLRRTELAWLAAWPVALLLRWAFTSQAPPPAFALITLITNALFLGVWRGLFALAAARAGAAGKRGSSC